MSQTGHLDPLPSCTVGSQGVSKGGKVTSVLVVPSGVLCFTLDISVKVCLIHCTEEVNIPSVAPGYSKQRTIRAIIYVSSINFHIFGNYQI